MVSTYPTRAIFPQMLEYDFEYLRWAYGMLDYWDGCLESSNDASQAFTGKGDSALLKLQQEARIPECERQKAHSRCRQT